MIKTIIAVSHFTYFELPKQHNVNATKIRDSWQYDARASRYDNGVRRTHVNVYDSWKLSLLNSP